MLHYIYNYLLKNHMFNSLIIIGAKYLIALPLLATVVFFFQQEKNTKKMLAIFSVVILPLIFIVAKIASKLYSNPRPFVVGHFTPLITHSADNGFPSDHTLLASAVAMAVFYFNRKLGTILMIIALLVGLSRVLAGVHHLVDIFGSIIISIIVSSLVYYFLKSNLLRKD